MQRGATLPELVTVSVLVGLVAAIVTPALRRTLDAMAVREAADRYAVLHETARHLAIARGRPVAVTLDTAGPRAHLVVERTRTSRDTAAVRSLGAARITTSQPTVTFGPLGFALGVSNTRIVITRGQAAETLTVSRTGRLKRW